MSERTEGHGGGNGGAGNGGAAPAGGGLALSRKDFVSDQEVRWCPGCGDYSILAQVQKMMPTLGIPREKMVFVSGIGCSSRFPYYMNTYGFHSIHGRALTVASGIKVARPDLTVWVVTGDGDCLSIGGNHLLHTMRRNVDLKVLLFNNRIYGLTKGQYSPTSEYGKKTKSSPLGSSDYPLHPVSVALAAEATFVARSIDTDTKHLTGIIERAAAHKGAAFVEIFQNCNIYNDGAWDHLKEKENRQEHVVELVHGKPVVFGKNRDWGVRLNGFHPEVVHLGDGVSEADLVVHDEHEEDWHRALIFGRMDQPNFPVAIGVLRQVERPTYENLLEEQVQVARRLKGEGNLRDFLYSGETWEVK